MTFKPSNPFSSRAPVNQLDYEIAQEKASTLGRLGRALEAALEAIRSFDGEHPLPRQPEHRRARAALVAQAGVALWHFVVQREACGLRDSPQVMRDYRVPVEVRNRMGAFPAKPARERRESLQARGSQD